MTTRLAHLTGDTFIIRAALNEAGWRWDAEKRVYSKVIEDNSLSESDIVRFLRLSGGIRNRAKTLNVAFVLQTEVIPSA